MAPANSEYDYIVVGCGGIGSGAVYWLSRRAGKKVLGLEQFELGHDKGGSQDHSRIIRLNYPDVKYARLTPHTYEAFSEVERESGLKLVHKTGNLDLAIKGTPGADVLEMYAKAMDHENIKYERFDYQQLTRRFPQFTLEQNTIGLYQADGGLVDAALTNSVHVQLARARGATVLDRTPVTRIDTVSDTSALVYTPRGTFSCKKVIVTAGAWINNVLGSVGVHFPITVTQEQVTYYATPNIKKFTKDNFPVFVFHGFKGNGDYMYYGMPMHVNSFTKIGMDSAGPAVSAETRTFQPDPVREEQCREVLNKYIPEFLGPKMYTKTCLYTMPRDRNFIIDTLASKDKPQIIVCNGAGHAFKFVSLLGKILSQLSLDGTTDYNISEFTINRPAVCDPNYDALAMRKKPLYANKGAKL